MRLLTSFIAIYCIVIIIYLNYIYKNFYVTPIMKSLNIICNILNRNTISCIFSYVYITDRNIYYRYL